VSTGELLFLPLGGAGEIGMNLNLYGYDGQWLMVDLGITFADDSLPGVDVLTPDTTFIEGERENLLALVLTHAHEDHLGAVPYLWERLRCPIYATRFAAAVLERKFADFHVDGAPSITVVDYGESFTVGPFSIDYMPITHSIPEGSALTLRTPAGTVFHTGDWKLDPNPGVGPRTDEEHLKRIGDDGVLAMVCDSTNVFGEGESGSEGAVKESLLELVGPRKGRVVVSTFSSNIARIQSIAEVAAAHGRTLAVAGRSLWRMIEAARASGYLSQVGDIAKDDEIPMIPRDKVLILCTGCQGEPRGALSRIAYADHPFVALEEGDTVVFSSKIIPGNERPIGALCNRLVASGIEVLTERTHFVHVSGHPKREELRRMYAHIRPRIAVPVHGEAVHLAEHAALARSLGVPQPVTPFNGAVIRLSPAPVEVVERVTAGRFAVDDRILVSTDSEAIRERRRLMYNGAVIVAIQASTDGVDVRVSLHGLASEPGEDLEDELEAEIEAMIQRLPRANRLDPEEIELAVRRAANRTVKLGSQKRPLIDVSVFVNAAQPRRKRMETVR